MARLRVKRGTYAQLQAAGTAGQLVQGEPYLVTDQGRLGVGTSATGWSAHLVWSDIGINVAAFSHTHPYAPLAHAHTVADVTGLQTALDGKAATAHTHTIANVTNLQTALDGKQAALGFTPVQQGTGTGQGANAVKVGWSTSTSRLKATVDVTDLGNFVFDAQLTWGNVANKPATFAPAAHVHVIADVTNLQTTLDGKAPTVHAHAIADVTNLQATLDGKAITAHVHDGAAITTGTVAVGRLPTGATGTTVALGNHTHTQYAATAHTHTIANVTDLQTTLDGKAATGHSHTEYAATAHTHTIANVTNLQTTLDGKAATAHTHTIANVTGLQTALDGKQASLGFTPVQQGTGVGQTTNAVKIGWSTGGRLKATVDVTDQGNFVFDGHLIWANVANKPTEFTPAAHTHTIANVTGLQTALDGKLPNWNPIIKAQDTTLEGGQLVLQRGPTSNMAGDVNIDLWQTNFRIFEWDAATSQARGVQFDFTSVPANSIQTLLHSTNFAATLDPVYAKTAHNHDAANITSGVLPDGRLNALYTGASFFMEGTSRLVYGPGVAGQAVRYAPNVSLYRGQSNTTTGAIVLTAPVVPTGNIIHRVEIEGSLYSPAQMIRMVLTGTSNPTTPAWSLTKKLSFGTVDVQTRFGYTPGGVPCVILGDVGTVWSWPVIRTAMTAAGGPANTAYLQGWTTTLVTDLTGYKGLTADLTNQQTVTQVAPAPSTKPLAMGRVTSTGAVLSGSYGFTVHKGSAGIFSVILNPVATAANAVVCQCTPLAAGVALATAHVDVASVNTINVYTGQGSANYAASDLGFSITVWDLGVAALAAQQRAIDDHAADPDNYPAPVSTLSVEPQDVNPLPNLPQVDVQALQSQMHSMASLIRELEKQIKLLSPGGKRPKP